jgi:cytochrome c553
MFDFVGVLILVILIALFAFLFVRSWGSKKAWLKWSGLVLAGLLTLLLTLVLVVAMIGFYKLNASPGNPVSNLKAGGTPEQLARAGRWAGLCAECHSTQRALPLDGSAENFFSGPNAPPMGTMYPPNLTSAGPLKDWSDGEIIRAIREGVHKNGRPLIIMPAEVFHNISDTDVQALVAYLRSQPGVQHDTPENNFSTIGAILVGTGAPIQTNQQPITQPVVSPPPGVSPEYGQYLVSIMACHICHGANLAGGTPGGFGPPPGPNLTVLVPKWSEADFTKTIRTGVDPTGKSLNPELMPWKALSSALSDDELKAVYAYMKGLQPIIKPPSQ